MKRQIKIFIATVGISLSIFGCSTGPQPTQTKPITSPKKEITIKLNFPKKDPVTNQSLQIHKNQLLSQIEDDMYNFSNYYKFKIIGHGPVDKYAGIEITRNPNYYNIDYKNGEYNTNQWFLTKVKFQVPYKYSTNSIKLIYPNQYTLIPCNDAIGVKIDLLDKPSNLKKDVFYVLNNLKNIKLSISKKYILKGVINAKYSADSIYANFKRLMGQYTGKYYWTNSTKSISPIEKENTFNLKIKKKIYPINIKVYPYRNGSKVVYKAYISYRINSDGTSTLIRQDIENAKKEIKEVVNN